MWVKICGFTVPEDAVAAAHAGASALGLNFYPQSRRFVDSGTAATICRMLRKQSKTQQPDLVGVFVNASIQHIAEVTRELSLSAVQLHGDESVTYIRELNQTLPQTPLIRALRVSPERLETSLAHVDELTGHVPLAACLLDAWVDGEYGGTGHCVATEIVEAWFRSARPRLILAGGLRPSNVETAIRNCHPWGVDVASGVEHSPGRKALSLVQEFIQACGRATGNDAGDRLMDSKGTP